MLAGKVKAVLAGVILSLLVALAFLAWQNWSLIEDKARQAATIMQQQAELADKQRRVEDLARQRDAAEALAAREKARSVAIREQARGLKYDIEQLERINPAVRDWGDTAMPAELVDLLRRAPHDRAD